MTGTREDDGFRVPGPRPHPLFGRQYHVVRMLLDPLASMGRLFDTVGPVAALVAGGGTRFYSPRPVCPGTVFVHGAALAQQVLGHPDVFHSSPASGRLYPLAENVPPRLAPLKHWGAGLFALNDDEHRRHRRMMLPVFQKAHVSSYRDRVVAITGAWLDTWQPGRTIDFHQETIGLAQRVATEVLFGSGSGALAQSTARALQESLHVLVHPAVLFLPFDVPGLPYRRFLNLAAEIDAALRRMLDQRRHSPPVDDVLGRLLQARDDDGSALDDDQLISHMNLLFAAGHESTANALAWTCFLLSQHPDVLADLEEELAAVLGGRPPTADELDDLPRLERVVLESLRILPPVPWIPRITALSTELGGFALPAGTEVLISVYHSHRDEHEYPEPARFMPERWQEPPSNTFEYLAFGGGPHRCIGAGFAMLELKVILAMLLQRFRLVLAPGEVDYAVRVTLTPKHGMPMRIHRRDDRRVDAPARGTIRRLVALPN